MQENPLVTVVCSCYNHSEYVIDCLNSVLKQTYLNVQIIVIDDFSTDDSVQIIGNFLENYPEIIFIKNSKNLGLTVSVNNAMKLANGDFFIDLAADDILLPNCIKIQIETYQNSKFDNLAIVFGNAEVVDELGQHLEYYFPIDDDFKTIPKQQSGDIYGKIISDETIICSVTALYKKSVFDYLSGYDESLLYEDFDYWIRVSRNFNIEFTDNILVKKRILKASMHSNFNDLHNHYGKTTYRILKNAYYLNRTKKEHSILKKRVMLEIKKSVKKVNIQLLVRNSYLYMLLIMKSL